MYNTVRGSIGENSKHTDTKPVFAFENGITAGSGGDGDGNLGILRSVVLRYPCNPYRTESESLQSAPAAARGQARGRLVRRSERRPSSANELGDGSERVQPVQDAEAEPT